MSIARYVFAGLALMTFPSAVVMASSGPVQPAPSFQQVRGALMASLAEDGSRAGTIEVDGCRALNSDLFSGTVYACRVAFEETTRSGARAVKSMTVALATFDATWRVVRR